MKSKESFGKRLIIYTKEGWGYLKESRIFIYCSAAFFFASFLIGFFFSDAFSFFYKEILKQMAEMAANIHGINLGIFIFFSNFRSAFYSLFLGILAGIFPVFNILFNGSLIGYVFRSLWDESGAVYFWRILPHGIFELPALFISWGLGIRIGMFIFSKNELKELKYRFENSLKTFFFIVVPLLIIAAIIETVLIVFLK